MAAGDKGLIGGNGFIEADCFQDKIGFLLILIKMLRVNLVSSLANIIKILLNKNCVFQVT